MKTPREIAEEVAKHEADQWEETPSGIQFSREDLRETLADACEAAISADRRERGEE
jgi:hypothetical protein